MNDYEHDSFYAVNIKYESQGEREFIALLDTGSTDLPQRSTRMSKGSRGNLYDTSKVEQVPDASFCIHYGDGGYFAGIVYRDTLLLGDLRIPNFPVEAVSHSEASGPNKEVHFDAILGLAGTKLSTILPEPSPNAIQVAANNGMIKSVVAFDFHHDVSGLAGEGGTVTFGGYVNDFGVLTWVPRFEDEFWTIETTSWKSCEDGEIHQRPAAKFHRKKGALPEDSKRHAIVDSGTTLMFLDEQTTKDIYAAIPGAMYVEELKSYVLPEKPLAGAPEAIYFEFGSTWIPIPYELGGLLYADAQETGVTKDGIAYSFGALQGSKLEYGDIWGMPFFRSAYLIFDAEHQRIGAVPKKIRHSSGKKEKHHHVKSL